MTFDKQTKQRNSLLKENYEKQLKEHNTNSKPLRSTKTKQRLRENRLKQICYTRSSVNTAANFMLEKWPSKMRKRLTDAKLSKNDVQTEPLLTNNNGEIDTAHIENDLSEMD